MGEQELAEGYTAGQAAEIMTRNRIEKFKKDHDRQDLTEDEISALNVAPDYVRKCAQKGWIRSIPIHNRLTLYNKDDVNNYIVEGRGTKAGRAAQSRAKTKKVAQ